MDPRLIVVNSIATTEQMISKLTEMRNLMLISLKYIEENNGMKCLEVSNRIFEIQSEMKEIYSESLQNLIN